MRSIQFILLPYPSACKSCILLTAYEVQCSFRGYTLQQGLTYAMFVCPGSCSCGNHLSSTGFPLVRVLFFLHHGLLFLLNSSSQIDKSPSHFVSWITMIILISMKGISRSSFFGPCRTGKADPRNWGEILCSTASGLQGVLS